MRDKSNRVKVMKFHYCLLGVLEENAGQNIIAKQNEENF